ncbi:hypothetical protein RNJ44_01260 [Nakaseomyces bracarensis]|uniref:Phosphatidylinositol N-acetylglucosaminyltransferase subunit H conserved domain-containing protein n=1 Tax=Nakaseomyces bracarensis TaxID=273131 RepID=A0ABR4NRL9_9SACH
MNRKYYLDVVEVPKRMVKATVRTKSYRFRWFVNVVSIVVIQLLFHKYVTYTMIYRILKYIPYFSHRYWVTRLLLHLLTFYLTNDNLCLNPPVETVSIVRNLGIQIEHAQVAPFSIASLNHNPLDTAISKLIPRDRILDVILYETFNKTGFQVTCNLAIMYRDEINSNPKLKVLYDGQNLRLVDQMMLYNKFQDVLRS